MKTNHDPSEAEMTFAEMIERYEPTEVELLAAELTGKGKTSHVGREMSLSVRLPYSTGIQVAALAQNSGMSKNKVFCRLIDVGLDALKAQMSEADRDRVFNCIEAFKQERENA